jgi:thiamine-monophosphate kinase
MNNEFEIINKYFSLPVLRDDVLLAGGDDCASVIVPENKQLLVTTDTLISGVHFPAGTSPEDIAHKAIMVNLSDLAAMGASPAWLTLAITLPEVDENWLSRFSNSFADILKRFNMSLIGGDTTKGALSITIQAMGLCDRKSVLRRDRAKPGDKIYVTGNIGDAAIGLYAILNNLADDDLQPCITSLNRPEAKVNFAQELLPYSDCAIDVSDGLVADLGHILEASNCGAKVLLSEIPRSSATKYYFDRYNHGETDWQLLLTQGDDYELCFTVREGFERSVDTLAEKHRLKISCIGEITENTGLDLLNTDGEKVNFVATGFKHF